MDPNGTTVTTCIICTLIEAVSRTLACPPGAADNSSEGTGVADYKRVGLIASTSDVFRPLLRCESLSASESVKRASTPWTKEPLEPCTLKAQSSTASDGSASARSRARAKSTLSGQRPWPGLRARPQHVPLFERPGLMLFADLGLWFGIGQLGPRVRSLWKAFQVSFLS